MPIFFIIFVHFTNQSFDDRVSSENNLQFFRWFSIKSFDTAKYELIVQHLFMTALITDSSPKFGQPDPICQNNKGCGLLKNHVKIYLLYENVDKITTQSCFVKQPIFGIISWSVNFWNGPIFTPFFQKFTD